MNRLEEIYNLSKVIAGSVHFGEHNDENMLAQDILDAGYGDVKQYQDEIARLQTELMHREEDLVHADEKVFYREMAVKLDEDKIKKQAVKEFAERVKREFIEGDGTYLDEYDEGFTAGYNTSCKEHKAVIDTIITELYGADE